MGIVIIYLSNSSHSIFSLFWRENIFVDLGRKHLDPTNFFPPLPPTKKIFFLIFFPKFYIHPISLPNKHTLRDWCGLMQPAHMQKLHKWHKANLNMRRQFAFLDPSFIPKSATPYIATTTIKNNIMASCTMSGEMSEPRKLSPRSRWESWEAHGIL